MTVLPFARYELRRHLPALASTLLALAILPVTRRLIVEDWSYRDGIWNVWGAVLALYVLAPLLALAMTASGWARERALGTLDWLYARPLSSLQLFFIRAATIAAAASIWSAAALAVQGVTLDELELALSIVPGLPGPVTLFFANTTLALGAGLLASTLASSSENAFRWSLLLVSAAWLVAIGVARSAGPTSVKLVASEAGESYFLDRSLAAAVFLLGGAFTAGAARAVASAPDDPRRSRRAVPLGAVLSAAALVAFASWLQLPRLAGKESADAIWLGGDRGMTFAPALGLENRDAERWQFAHPVLREGERSTVLRNIFTMGLGIWGFDSASAGPSGAAVLWSLPDGWLVIEPDGSTRGIELLPHGTASVIGWSSTGRRFAWLWTPWEAANSLGVAPPGHMKGRLIVLEADRSLRFIPIRDIGWNAAWVDDATLLLAPVFSATNPANDSDWSLVDVETSTTRERTLVAGIDLEAPALHPWRLSQSVLPTLGGTPVLMLIDPAALEIRGSTSTAAMTAPRLARLDVAAGTLEPGRELAIEASPLSMGTLDDDSLVWAAGDRRLAPARWTGGETTRIFNLSSMDAEPRQLCTIPDGRIARFRGQSGAWAIWESLLFPDYPLWGCNLETGAARELAEWRPWSHPLATIGHRGLWTAEGWKPIE